MMETELWDCCIVWCN